MKLGDLGDLMKDSYNPAFSRALSESIWETVWPWKPRELITFMDYSIDDDQHRITVEVRFEGVEGWLYWFQMPWFRDMDEEVTLWGLCQEIRHHFRHWRKEPESNIELGEN